MIYDVHEEFLVIRRFQVEEFNNYSKTNDDSEDKSMRLH